MAHSKEIVRFFLQNISWFAPRFLPEFCTFLEATEFRQQIAAVLQGIKHSKSLSDTQLSVLRANLAKKQLASATKVLFEAAIVVVRDRKVFSAALHECSDKFGILHTAEQRALAFAGYASAFPATQDSKAEAAYRVFELGVCGVVSCAEEAFLLQWLNEHKTALNGLDLPGAMTAVEGIIARQVFERCKGELLSSIDPKAIAAATALASSAAAAQSHSQTESLAQSAATTATATAEARSPSAVTTAAAPASAAPAASDADSESDPAIAELKQRMASTGVSAAELRGEIEAEIMALRAELAGLTADISGNSNSNSNGKTSESKDKGKGKGRDKDAKAEGKQKDSEQKTTQAKAKDIGAYERVVYGELVSRTAGADGFAAVDTLDVMRYSAALEVAWKAHDEAGLQIVLGFFTQCCSHKVISLIPASTCVLLQTIAEHAHWVNPLSAVLCSTAAALLLSRLTSPVEAGGGLPPWLAAASASASAGPASAQSQSQPSQGATAQIAAMLQGVSRMVNERMRVGPASAASASASSSLAASDRDGKEGKDRAPPLLYSLTASISASPASKPQAAAVPVSDASLPSAQPLQMLPLLPRAPPQKRVVAPLAQMQAAPVTVGVDVDAGIGFDLEAGADSHAEAGADDGAGADGIEDQDTETAHTDAHAHAHSHDAAPAASAATRAAADGGVADEKAQKAKQKKKASKARARARKRMMAAGLEAHDGSGPGLMLIMLS